MKTKLFKLAGIIMLSLACLSRAHGQFHPYFPHQAQKQIGIGDTIPDLILTHFLHQPGRQTPVSDLYQKGLLIINFWATWCGSCIHEMPLLNELAKKNDSIRVISVAYEPDTIVSSFFAKHENIIHDKLEILTDDTLLLEYFKHILLPHNIWVDKQGVVRYITGQDAISPENVTKFLRGIPFEDVEIKKDVRGFNFGKPFHLRDSNFSYRSILSSYTPGIVGSLWFGTETGMGSQEVWYGDRFFVSDLSLHQILWMAHNLAFNLYGKNYYNTMEIITKDSTKFFFPEQCPVSFKHSRYRSEYQWKHENTYVYEQIIPKPVRSNIFSKYVLQDLARYFNLSYSTRIKNMECTVLRLNRQKAKKKFNRAINDSAYITFLETGVYCHNVTLTRIMEYLNAKFKDNLNDKPIDPPYINRSGIDYPIDIVLPCTNQMASFKLFREFKQFLKEEYGLDLKREFQPHPVFVVKDNGDNQ